METGEHQRKPRLCFVGPLVGRNPGLVTTQGEILADLFRDAGYSVIAVSEHRNRFRRLFEILWTLIRRWRQYDILMLQSYAEYSFVIEDMASLLARLSRKPITMVLRGGTIPDFMKRFPRWSRRVFGRADGLVAPSRYLARIMESSGFPTRVIPNVINLDLYPFGERCKLQPKLLWMRSFYDYYNPAMAVRVLARVRHKYPEATLVMGGPDKGELAAVKRLVAEMGLEEAVSFPGFLDMAAKRNHFETCDIYLNTNNIDNMPVSVVESCAMGVPVIATAVGGLPDLLTHELTGLLVPDDDDGAMAESVCRLLREPDLANCLSREGRKLAEQSGWPEVHDGWRGVFDHIWSESQSSNP